MIHMKMCLQLYCCSGGVLMVMIEALVVVVGVMVVAGVLLVMCCWLCYCCALQQHLYFNSFTTTRPSPSTLFKMGLAVILWWQIICSHYAFNCMNMTMTQIRWRGYMYSVADAYLREESILGRRSDEARANIHTEQLFLILFHIHNLCPFASPFIYHHLNRH